MSSYKHGVYAYQKKNCRCEECIDIFRAYRRNQAIKRKSDASKARLSGQVFVDRIMRDGRHEAISKTTMFRWCKYGMSIYTADHFACQLGYHPYEIWGDDFYVGTVLSTT